MPIRAQINNFSRKNGSRLKADSHDSCHGPSDALVLIRRRNTMTPATSGQCNDAGDEYGREGALQ
jgi:hypothetical protein